MTEHKSWLTLACFFHIFSYVDPMSFIVCFPFLTSFPGIPLARENCPSAILKEAIIEKKDRKLFPTWKKDVHFSGALGLVILLNERIIQ